MKRALIILASIVVLAGIGIGVYFIFFSKDHASLSVGNGDAFGDTGSGLAAPADITTGPNAGTIVAPHLIRITTGPVALGAVAVDIQSPADGSVASTSSTTAATVPDVDVRYVDRASGNVYSYTVHGRVLTRISNKTLPGVQEASWLPDGSMAYVRYLSTDTMSGTDHVQTYALPADGNGGFFLEQDLDEAKIMNSTTLFTLLAGTTGSVGTISKAADGTGAKTLFTSLLSSFVVYPSGGSYFAQTKASAQLDGYAFMVNSISGAFTRILGPLRGLSVLPSPDGKSLLYSYVDGSTVHLSVIDTTSRAATSLPLGTLSEKCVWSDNLTIYCGVPTSVSGTLPDDWYQGAVSFTDRIWRIDMTARIATLVVDPKSVADTSIDAEGLTVDPKGDALIFTDKTTGSLWAYDF